MSEVTWSGAENLGSHLVPIEELVEFPNNPKRDYQHIRFIVKSLREYGQVRAILTWANAEEFGLPKNTIVGGHHVWFAAQEDDLEWTHVAVIPAEFSSLQSAQDYLVLDNISSLRNQAEVAGQLALTDNPELREHARGILESGQYLEQVAELKQHERSVRRSPDEIIEHMAASLKEVGFTNQVIIARDGTILAGEDVMRAAALAGIDRVPVKRMDLDPNDPEALKIMALDYTGGKQAMVDDRAFAELLKNIKDELGELEGTGYDSEMLAGLLMITRTAAEIKDVSEAYEWIGLSEYEPVSLPSKLIISFETDEARTLFMDKLGMISLKQNLGTISTWWPPRDRQDPGSLRFEGKDRPAGKGDHLPAHDLGIVHADAVLAEMAE